MNIKQALIESTKTRDTARFTKLIDKLDQKGTPVIDLPLMVLNANTVGIAGHQWAWDTIEEWQVS
jgi:hypothetical protein